MLIRVYADSRKRRRGVARGISRAAKSRPRPRARLSELLSSLPALPDDALVQKEREFRNLILRAYRAEPLANDSFFHGKTAGRLVVVGPINLPVGRLFVEEVITECRKRGATRADVLAFEFEMGLFPAVLDEAKQKGLDLVPKFHDVSFVEATPQERGRLRAGAAHQGR